MAKGTNRIPRINQTPSVPAQICFDVRVHLLMHVSALASTSIPVCRLGRGSPVLQARYWLRPFRLPLFSQASLAALLGPTFP